MNLPAVNLRWKRELNQRERARCIECGRGFSFREWQTRCISAASSATEQTVKHRACCPLHREWAD